MKRKKHGLTRAGRALALLTLARRVGLKRSLGLAALAADAYLVFETRKRHSHRSR